MKKIAHLDSQSSLLSPAGRAVIRSAQEMAKSAKTKKADSFSALAVVEYGTGKIIHQVPVSGKSEREVEKVERGMLRNMDTNKFYVAQHIVYE